MPQAPKRLISELKPAELQSIVREMQELLWVHESATDDQRSNGARPASGMLTRSGTLTTSSARLLLCSASAV